MTPHGPRGTAVHGPLETMTRERTFIYLFVDKEMCPIQLRCPYHNYHNYPCPFSNLTYQKYTQPQGAEIDMD